MDKLGEVSDVVKNMEKKHSEALKHKRSFFVRMVSDPKLYNPKIVKVECNFLIGLSINKKTKLIIFPLDGSKTETI